MRILVCTHDIDSGGSARSLSILVEHLAKKHTLSVVSLIAPDPHKKIARRYFELGIKLSVFPWGWLPVSYINCPVNNEQQRERCSRLRAFVPEVRKLAEDVDLICFNSYPATSLSSLFPKSIPRFLIARDVMTEGTQDFERAGRFLCGQIRKAVAIGPVESAQLHAFGIPHTIIYNSAPQKPRMLPLPPLPPLRFGVFTQFTLSKGVDVLALAVEKAAADLRRCNAEVHVYGGMADRNPDTLEGQIYNFTVEKHLQDVFHLEGWINDVESAMQNMHCIVRPDSTGSPWGRDVLEAMSLGRPVLGTGMTDVFVKEGVTGWLVPPRDPSALARALAGLGRAPSLVRRLGENAYAFAREHFDPEINSRRIEEEMLSIVG